MLDQLFTYHDRNVRVAGTPETPLFVAKDVCAVLGLENNRRALMTLDDDEKASVTLSDTTASSRKSITMQAVNEFGLYTLIFKSQKAEAKQFQRWVNHEVLPQIRKTGSYGAAPAPTIEQVIADPDSMIQLLTELKQQRGEAARQTKRAEALAPIAQFGNELMDSADLFTITQIAKPLGTGPVTLNRFLAEEGMIRKHHAEWWPMHRFQDSGHFRVVAHTRMCEDALTGTQQSRTFHQIKVTAKGRELIHRKWRDAGHGTPAHTLKAQIYVS